MTHQRSYRNRGGRIDGPCSACGSSNARAHYENGEEYCFSCRDQTTGKKTGAKKFLKRGIPKESRQVLKDYWDLPPAGAHPYLRSHRHRGGASLQFVSDIRQDGEKIVVPLYDVKGTLRNLQYIYPDGKKRTLAGISTTGLFLRIGDGSSKQSWIVEGWATGETVHDATGEDVYVAFGCANLLAVAEYVKSLGKHVAVCGEVGATPARIAEEVAAAVGGDLFVPQFPEGATGTDANDLAQKLGIAELKKQITKDTAPIPPMPDPFDVAAGMAWKDYKEIRPHLANTLNLSVQQLDREVRDRRQAISFAEPEPWHEPVDGRRLVEDLEQCILRYVSLPDDAATTIALWVMTTYLVDDEDYCIAAILACLSPTKRCGKSTLMKVLKGLVFRPYPTSNTTPAVIFRVIEEYRPTFLIDEFDSFKDINPEMRGILNSGHDREMAFVDRCVGDDHKPRRFCTFGPKAVAAIGRIPSTLEDRSIIIQMRRKLADEKKRRMKRPKEGDNFDQLRRQIARWLQDNGEGLCALRVRYVAGLNDRAFDNWRPILQIAKRIGGKDYEAEIAKVALKITTKEEGEEDATSGILLLKDLRELFDRDGGDRLATTFILDALHGMDDRPWPEYKQLKPITSNQLAKLLKPFGIRPRQKRRRGEGRKGKPMRGYWRSMFDDAFSRYLP